MRRDGLCPPRRDDVYGNGTSLRGIDLIGQIAANTKIQKQRWIDLYHHLWERKAKIDIADTIIIDDGVLNAWFFTSAVTGEIQRKSESHLNAIAIKKNFVRENNSMTVTRQLAVLVHEDAVGDMSVALLNDLDFNVALCQMTSPLWSTSFLLQPIFSASRLHPQYNGTYVAKFNTTSSIHVFHSEQSFPGLKRAGTAPTIGRQASVSAARCRKAVTPRGVEDLIRLETTKLVAEIEAATHESLRQLHAEFQITRSHRLVLVRVAHVVYVSDLQRRRMRGASPSRTRPSSAGPTMTIKHCAGGRFCHCKAMATGEMHKTSTALSSSNDLQQTTRKSLQLCEEETIFLDKFGAHNEAHLEAAVLHHTSQKNDSDAFKRVLQRRLFMLRSTLWNPASECFNVKPFAWEDEKTKQSQQYEMVRVCRTCYLIYHTMDAERFQATKSTVKAAARRLTMIHNAKMRAPERPRTAWDGSDPHSEQSAVNVHFDLGDEADVGPDVLVPTLEAETQSGDPERNLHEPTPRREKHRSTLTTTLSHPPERRETRVRPTRSLQSLA